MGIWTEEPHVHQDAANPRTQASLGPEAKSHPQAPRSLKMFLSTRLVPQMGVLAEREAP